MLTHTLMIRREKSHVQAQLPPKVRHRIALDCPPAAALWSQLDNKQADATKPGGSGGAAPAQQHRPEMAQAYMDTGVLKADAVAGFVRRLLGTGPKVLVFGHHRAVLNRLEELLRHEWVEGEGRGSWVGGWAGGASCCGTREVGLGWGVGCRVVGWLGASVGGVVG